MITSSSTGSFRDSFTDSVSSKQDELNDSVSNAVLPSDAQSVLAKNFENATCQNLSSMARPRVREHGKI